MLLLADRYYFGFDLWNQAAASGADLLWRTKANHNLAVDRRLSDGFISVTSRPATMQGEEPGRREGDRIHPRRSRPLPGRGHHLSADHHHRRPRGGPAEELAGLYRQRWEFETTLDELKSHQRGPQVVLRSKNPDGVRQEAYGFFCTHYAIRALMATVADDHGIDPDQVSFTRSLHATRRSIRSGVGTSAKNLTEALRCAITEIGHELLPQRRRRKAERVVKRKMSNYHLKRADHHSMILTEPPAITILGNPA